MSSPKAGECIELEVHHSAQPGPSTMPSFIDEDTRSSVEREAELALSPTPTIKSDLQPRGEHLESGLPTLERTPTTMSAETLAVNASSLPPVDEGFGAWSFVRLFMSSRLDSSSHRILCSA